MKLLLLLGAGALAFGVSSGPAFAHDCWHHGRGYYDCDGHCGSPMNSQAGPQSAQRAPARPAVNLKTVEGKIVEVIYLPGTTPESGMVDIRVENSGTANLVRLAPSGFLKQSGLRLQEGDTVTIEAFPVAGMRGDLMVATRVHGSGLDVRLRDSAGQPLW